MISVIIPFKQDFEIIEEVLKTLKDTSTGVPYEVVIVNDGSKYPNNKFRPLEVLTHDGCILKVINNEITRGVGYSFDRGVEVSIGDMIVLMGSDVFMRPGWDRNIVKAIETNPDSLGCASSLGLSEGNRDMDKEGIIKRYGADLIITLDISDLPDNSPTRTTFPEYRSIFDGKWRKEGKNHCAQEIPCLMGACYFTTKKYYRRLNGWDTSPFFKWQGHRTWGSLEPYISLKAWLEGGGCILYPFIEAGHIFSRVDKKDRFAKGARSRVDMWWNKLFMLETMVLDEELKQRIFWFPNRELSFNTARRRILQNKEAVRAITMRNMTLFKHNLYWFMEKFGISLKV